MSRRPRYTVRGWTILGTSIREIRRMLTFRRDPPAAFAPSILTQQEQAVIRMEQHEPKRERAPSYDYGRTDEVRAREVVPAYDGINVEAMRPRGWVGAMTEACDKALRMEQAELEAHEYGTPLLSHEPARAAWSQSLGEARLAAGEIIEYEDCTVVNPPAKIYLGGNDG